MLYGLAGFVKQRERPYGVDDLSMVVGLRAHAGNPWVIDRLALLASHYEPRCEIVIVDFGSEGSYQRAIEEHCARLGMVYERVADTGVYSLSRARNSGARRARGPLLFFSDIDCFGPSDLLLRLIEQANSIELGTCFDQVINLPVYHLAEEASSRFFAAPKSARDDLLRRFMALGVYGPNEVEYVDPHSNFFLCRRELYELVGGYNANFRGHGSEDFEFFIRLALHTRQFPMPARLAEDRYSPRRESFFSTKRYRGFRQLLAMMALPAEAAGLRIAHLHHPRGGKRSEDPWYRLGDRGRSNFRKQITPVLHDRAALLESDFLPRDKRALVLIKDRAHVDFFLPLRLAGYAFEVVRAEDEASVARGLWAIEQRTVDAVMVFNPYMASHRPLRPLFERARQLGLETTVVERGMLPESWYYATDVAYNDPEYARSSAEAHPLSRAELAVAEAYLERLKKGQATLEQNGSYDATLERRMPLKPRGPLCLIPLQLDDDIAVTHYNAGFAGYADFRASIESVAAQFPDVTFLIKGHPLSKQALALSAPNVVVCAVEDNIHALIELADAVVCYNSGVGFLSLCHGKPTAVVGNAFYASAGALRAPNLSAAVEHVRGAQPPEPQRVLNYLAWLLHHKYAFFTAKSRIREVAHRRTHGYTELTWYALPGVMAPTRRASISCAVDPRSYAAGRLSLGGGEWAATVRTVLAQPWVRDTALPFGSKQGTELKRLLERFRAR